MGMCGTRKGLTGGSSSHLGRLTCTCFALLLFTSKISCAGRSEYSALMEILNSSSINQHTRPCVPFGGCEEDNICPYISDHTSSARFEFNIPSEAPEVHYLHNMTDLDFNQCSTDCYNSSIKNRVPIFVGEPYVGEELLIKIADNLETGCYKLQYGSGSSNGCCFWLRTRHMSHVTINATSIRNLHPIYNESLRTLSLSGQVSFKPVVLCLKGNNLQTPQCCMENEQTGFFECSDHHNTSCNRESSDTFGCTFHNISRGYYHVLYGVIRNMECIKTKCSFQSTYFYNSSHLWGSMTETSSLKTAESPLLQDSILVIVLVMTFILAILCLVIGICYLHHKIQSFSTSVPPLSSQGNTNFPSFILKKGILLVYPPECPGFQSAMGILSQILGNALHCNVYDIFDSKYGSEVHEEDAYIWLARKMRYVDKVVIIETDISHIIQYTTARFIHTSSVEEGLLKFYQSIDTFLLEPLINCKLHFVRLDQFSPEVRQVSSLMSSFQPNEIFKNIDSALRPAPQNPSYTLPQSMRRLLADLTVGVLDGEPCSVDDQSTVQSKSEILCNALRNLASYKAKNSDYHMNIVMSEP